MISLTSDSPKRVAVAALNAMSFGMAAYATVMLCKSIVSVFGLVTIGLYGPQAPLELIPYVEPAWVAKAILVSGVVAALVLVGALDRVTSISFTFKSVVYPAPVVAFIAVPALSYRLLGVVLCAVTIVIYVRYLRGQARLRSLAVSAALMLAASIAPIDVSLQNVPGHPRVSHAGGGLLGREGLRMVEQGDLVLTGGCVSTYYEPRWVVVW